jgi:hypothetical protein
MLPGVQGVFPKRRDFVARRDKSRRLNSGFFSKC